MKNIDNNSSLKIIPRSFIQQSNRILKRLVILAIQLEQKNDFSVKEETIKEPALTYLAFLTDKLLDQTITSIMHIPIDENQENLSISQIANFLDKVIDDPFTQGNKTNL